MEENLKWMGRIITQCLGRCCSRLLNLYHADNGVFFSFGAITFLRRANFFFRSKRPSLPPGLKILSVRDLQTAGWNLRTDICNGKNWEIWFPAKSKRVVRRILIPTMQWGRSGKKLFVIRSRNSEKDLGSCVPPRVGWRFHRLLDGKNPQQTHIKN